MVTIENEVKAMEDDDTVVLTPEDIEKIQKEMLEQEKEKEKENDEQEEEWFKSYLLAMDFPDTPLYSLNFQGIGLHRADCTWIINKFNE